MATTIDPTDVLVAVADPNATAVLLLADALFWAAERYGHACAANEKAIDFAIDVHLTGRQRDHRIRYTRSDMTAALVDLTPLSDQYEALMARIGDNELCARVEATVWRDRRAEYAHAREVSEREREQRW